MNKELDLNSQKEFFEAEKLFKEKKFNNALKHYQNILKKFPNHLAVLNNIGQIYELQGKYEKAMEAFKKCYEINSNEKIFIHNLANIYFLKKDFVNSMPLLKKVIDIGLDHEGNCEKYAISLFNIKAFKETKDFITLIHLKYPKNDLLNRLLGRSLLNLNSHVEGLKYLQSSHGFIQLSPKGIKYLT